MKQAAEAFLDHWPTNKQQGPEFEQACQACKEAMDEGGPPERVRGVLLAAAVVAGIDIGIAGYDVG